MSKNSSNMNKEKPYFIIIDDMVDEKRDQKADRIKCMKYYKELRHRYKFGKESAKKPKWNTGSIFNIIGKYEKER